jgi:AcrR family transcriptional regulator
LDKRTKILNAAAGCFLRLGYAETSVDEIVTHSGVVKQTVYNYFTNKDALFKAVVEHLLVDTGLELHNDWYELSSGEFFIRMARAQLKMLQSPTYIDFLRLLVKESRRFPELQTMYACSIPGPIIEFVAGYIRQCPETAPALAANEAAIDTLSWTFRAALTGYATLCNLTTLVRETLPAKSVYISFLALRFQTLLRGPAHLVQHNLNGQSADAGALGEENRSAQDLLGAEEGRAFFTADGKRKVSAKRLAILNAAVNTYCLHGFAEASMDEVAKAAAVSKQTVYQHFGSKNKLYADVFREVLGQLSDLQEKYGSLSDVCRAHIEQLRRPWLLDYCRVVIGESQSFPHESGQLMLYFVSLGRKQLDSTLGAMNLADASLVGLTIRSVLGSYFLFRQIYVVGEHPYITEAGLIAALEAIADANGTVLN